MKLMIDGHVHIYDCYDLGKFFDTALTQLDKYHYALYGKGGEHVKILLLTEGKTNDFFARWKENGEFPNDSGYRFRPTGEDVSLVLEKNGEPAAYVVRGRQIVTAENLEVLSTGSAQVIEDGLPIDTVIDRLIEKNEPAVLAWGFMKWMFARAKVIDRVIDKYDSPYVMVGDNSGRPVFWPFPRLFKKAVNKNMVLLNGSDPLPFSSETAKPGTFGFALEGKFDPKAPGRSICDLLAAKKPVRLFGRRDGIFSFFRRQIKMYLKKYL